jgi:tellurite resistance protein TerC
MTRTVIFWIGFHLFIAIWLILDLAVFHRRPRSITFREACWFSALGIAIALLFNLIIYVFFGSEKALQFFTGYLIEKSLSVDNLFVFLLLFQYFRIPSAYQHKILYWGIIGALVFRITFILLGVVLVAKFHWMLYLFGALLVLTGIKFALDKPKKEPAKSLLLRFFQAILPVTEKDPEGNFFLKEKGKLKATTLFLALLMIESTDIMFAFDSIPAIFAITTDPFIIYTSNVFAILGLRSLYFILAASLEKLRYFKFGLAAVLVFVGAKMLLAGILPISVPISLLVIMVILGITIFTSVKRI